MTMQVSTDRSGQRQMPASESKAKDAFNQKGAMALARQLEQFWHEAGYPLARFWAVPVEERFPKVGTYEIYRVDSNLVNGLPPRYVRQ
jgi:hypothetical protein